MSRRFEQPENYRNRELSWLEFDYRVLRPPIWMNFL